MEEIQPVLNTPNQETPAPDAQPGMGAGLLAALMDVLETLLLSVVLFVIINALSARVRVDGFSMNPTLQDGEYVLVNRLAYRLGEPQRGDIIVFHYPLDPSQDLIKRVIGLPGDIIRIRNGLVYVNDVYIEEPYIADPPAYDGEWLVPEENLFVLGDNRNASADSHSWGPVSYDRIIGKAILIYWPYYEWGLIDHVEQVKATQ